MDSWIIYDSNCGVEFEVTELIKRDYYLRKPGFILKSELDEFQEFLMYKNQKEFEKKNEIKEESKPPVKRTTRKKSK